jgi:hypothetical protein
LKHPLATYLHDHLAGAAYAVDLVETLRKNYLGTDLGEFAARLQSEILADKQELHEIAGHFGQASDPIKDSAAWLSERVSRMKMNHSDSYGLGTFEALEFLRLGIHGKAALWQALARIASHYEALARVDFQRLSKRAQIQEDEVERYRVSLADQALVAQDTFSPPKDSRLDMAHRGRALANRHTVAQGVTDEAGHDIENPT